MAEVPQFSTQPVTKSCNIYNCDIIDPALIIQLYVMISH